MPRNAEHCLGYRLARAGELAYQLRPESTENSDIGVRHACHDTPGLVRGCCYPAAVIRTQEASADVTARERSWLLPAGIAVFAVAAAAYLLAIAAHPADTMLKGFDLGVYREGGRLVRSAPGTLYDWHQPGHDGIQFTYTPWAAMVFAPLSLIPLRTLEALAVLAGVAALIGTLSIAFRELAVKQRTAATLLLGGVCLWLQPVQRTLYLGQVELVLMVIVVWDMCQPDRRRWKGAGVGLAAAVKLVPLIFIAYLVLTRRLRAAAVAAAVFAATIAAGFAALPHASVQWWIKLNFVQAKRTGFVGVSQNQSLRGVLTRFAGSVAHGQTLWIVAAILVGVAGLAAAVMLDRKGFRFEGLMTVALTGLLISPISWDHHWVWVAPMLAVLFVAGTRSSRAWWALAGLFIAAFAGWPRFWDTSAGLLQGGLIGYAPSEAFPYGDSPKFSEYHWHGPQILAGNLYVLAGVVLFAVLLVTAVRTGSRDPAPSPAPARSA